MFGKRGNEGFGKSGSAGQAVHAVPAATPTVTAERPATAPPAQPAFEPAPPSMTPQASTARRRTARNED